MTEKTLLIGDGPTAHRLAAKLMDIGVAVTIATSRMGTGASAASIPSASPPPAGGVLDAASVVTCRQTDKGYALTLSKGDERLLLNTPGIVICDDYRRKPLFHRYGLEQGRHVVSLSQAVAFQKSPVDQQGSVVFLTGIYHESSPLICREVMATACKYAAQGQKVYILTGNLKVAGDGLEARYRTSRQAGVTYVKFNTEKPEISQLESGRAVVTFTDEITGHRFRLTPELTVVDEALSVSMFAADAAATLALEQDGDGFVQADNVHRLPVRTNRRGILAVGPSRGVMDLKQQVMDIHNAALACLQHEGSTAFLTPHAEITPGCVRCLTCYRSCPFGAISLNGSLTVVKELCEGCGICAAECPQKVIRMNDLADGSPAEQLVRLKPVRGERATHPVIYAFCCSRSAAQAAALAGVMGRPLPAGLRIIRVPCAGVIATGDILRAFQQKADGVMVLTCHQGNCQAEKGNLHARRRAEGAMVLMEQIGLDKKRLHYATLASNMAHEFGEIVCAFADSLENLYRSFLKG